MKAKPQGAKLVIAESTADGWFKWGGRTLMVLGPIAAGMWWLFGWYNGVEGLHKTVGGLNTKVEAMWAGQTTLLEDQKKITEVIKRIEPVVDRIDRQKR